MIENLRFWTLGTFKQLSWKISFLEFFSISKSNAPGLLRNKLQWNFNQNTQFSFTKMHEKSVAKVAAIFSMARWVKSLGLWGRHGFGGFKAFLISQMYRLNYLKHVHRRHVSLLLNTPVAAIKYDGYIWESSCAFILERNVIMTSSSENIFHVTGLCEGNPPVTGPSQRPVTRSFDILCALRLNKRTSNTMVLSQSARTFCAGNGDSVWSHA